MIYLNSDAEPEQAAFTFNFIKGLQGSSVT